MLNSILIGLLLIVVTSFIHTIITRIVLSIVQKKPGKQTPFRRIINIDLIILIIMVATLIESAIWALTYLQIGSFDMFEEALYFSLVTYSTLGYGDVILSDSHRLLGAFEATNGVIMLGWSTAIVVSALQKIYVKSTR